jgi:protease-4
MKQFLKFFFASLLGTFVTLIIIFLLFLGMIASMMTFSKKEKVEVMENTVLTLNLDTEILDRKPANPFAGFDWQAMESASYLGLNDILNNLRKAAEDPKIKGILLESPTTPGGMAILEEVRNALISFRESGKFIIAYADGYSQGGYYLATASDEIYMQPEGGIELKGLMADVVFFKKLLDKIDVEAQIIRHGKYKSAVEPFMLEKMSPENREQTQQFVGSIWQNIAGGIAQSRKIDGTRFTMITDSLLAMSPKNAVRDGLLDGLIYRDEIDMILSGRMGLDSLNKINYLDFESYLDAPEPVSKRVDRSQRIAVVYALGEVVNEEGNETSIGTQNITAALKKAREDKKVKAVVLRVNSPGGSALTSDLVWREVELTRKEKPVVASFGDVAASGGYYIACNATKIFAMPNTITGSIGVFGMIPNAQKLLSDRLGITFDPVKTNANSDFAGINRPLTPYQKDVILKSVEQVYETFTAHVAEGRGMTQARVDSIGQGRVWSGVDAKKLGLIDEFGGLKEAIAEAASLAGLETYKVVEFPEAKDPFTEIINQITGKKGEAMLKSELGVYYKQMAMLRNLAKAKGPIARMPFDVHFE